MAEQEFEIIVSDTDEFTTNLLNELLDDGYYDCGVHIYDTDDNHYKYCVFEWDDKIIIYINEEFIEDDEVIEEVNLYCDPTLLKEYDDWGLDYQGCAIYYGREK